MGSGPAPCYRGQSLRFLYEESAWVVLVSKRSIRAMSSDHHRDLLATGSNSTGDSLIRTVHSELDASD